MNRTPDSPTESADAPPERPWRVAMFVGAFPVISETFILRQIAGLLDAGHHVDLYADCRMPLDGPLPKEVQKHDLLQRTTFMDQPPESIPHELPAVPLTDLTWPPGGQSPIPNWRRVANAVPQMIECFAQQPMLAWAALQPSHYGHRARSLSALGRLNRLLSHSHRSYDVLHAHFGPVGESFRFARKLFHAPLVVSFHGYDFGRVPRQQGADVYRRLFADADAVTVNSQYTAGRLVTLGAPPSRMHVLPMSLPIPDIPFAPRHRPAEEPLRILSIGRLIPIKGHRFAMQALAQALPQLAPVEYHVVGDGPCLQTLRELAKELGIAGMVHFHGACPPQDIWDHYLACHLFLHTSISIDGDAEGQGLVLQEAQATGMPVIATRHGAFPEGMQDGITGRLVPELDVDALARTLIELKQTPDQWESMGRAGRQWAETRYDNRLLTRHLLDIYKHAADTPPWSGSA